MEERLREILRDAQRRGWRMKLREHLLRASVAVLAIIVWEAGVAHGYRSSYEAHKPPSHIPTDTPCVRRQGV